MIQRREKEDNLFFRLQQEALKKLQALSGEIWTDYNAHDPGVTILDAAHYALLDLQYRLDFPLESYLLEKNTIQFDKLGLFAEKILQPSVVTCYDYEQLIKTIDTVEQCRVSLSENHTYHIQVVLKADANKEQAKEEIEKTYHENRNLCERLGEITFEKTIAQGEKTITDETPHFMNNSKPDTPEQVFSPAYSSLQNHFPDCYGINEKGLPGGSSDLRRAQALQLKAYLLIFDYLIANSLHQAGNTKLLLGLSNAMPPGYKTNFSIGDLDKLLDNTEFKNHPLQDSDFLNSQKSYLLDSLDVIYGEDTRNIFPKESTISKANEKRAKLIQRLPELNKNRFKAINLLQNSSNNKSGLEQFVSAITGNNENENIPIINLFSSYNLHLVDDDTFFNQYQNLNMEYIFQYFRHHELVYHEEKIPVTEVKITKHSFYFLEKNLNFFWHNLLFESLLTEGSNPDNYRIIKTYGKEYNILVFKLKEKESWINLGYAFEKEKLIYMANLLWNLIQMLREKTSAFYLIEHILLDENTEDYNKLSLVIPTWSIYAEKENWLENLLHDRAPAHLNIRFVQLNAKRIYEFERNYYAWREALISKDESQMAFYAHELKMLL
jgi:hypothetical protein